MTRLSVGRARGDAAATTWIVLEGIRSPADRRRRPTPTQTLFSEGGFIRREPKTFRPSVFAAVDGDAKTEAGRQIQKRLAGQDPDKPKGFIKRVRPVGTAGGN